MYWHKRIVLVLGMLSCVAQPAFAAGITIPLKSSAYLGEALAGGSAVAEDATTNFYNPAGLVNVHRQQIVASAAFPYAYERFSGVMINPGNRLLSPNGSFISENSSASTNVFGMIPNVHYVYPITPFCSFGISLMTPYGLNLNYPSSSVVRYDVIEAKASSVELSPSIAYQILPALSVGIGLDELYFSIKLQNAVRSQPLTPIDSTIYNQASDFGTGWHAGLLCKLNSVTRLGLSYRSQIIMHLKGESELNLSPIRKIKNNDFKTTIPLPSLTILSIYHEKTPCWALFGSIEREGWGAWQYNHADGIAGVGEVVTPRKLYDIWYVAIGSRYKLTEQWLIRGGLSYLKGSTRTKYRDIVIPDPDTYGIGLGVRYQFTPALIGDIDYGHAFNKGCRINHFNTQTGNMLIGRSEQRGDSFGIQLTWNI